MNTEVRGRLLIVDDELLQLAALCDTLEMEGYATRGFSSAREALTALKPGQYDLLLTDLMMPEMDGISLIDNVRAIDPGMAAVVMTGHGTIDTAVLAMQAGALDYILKPFSLNIARPVIARALDLLQLRREVAALQAAERRRAEELAAAYADLESFSYSVSHDLRAPLLFVKDFALRLKEDFGGQLGEEGRRIAQLVYDGSVSMDRMIVGLLAFSRSTRQPLELLPVDMESIVRPLIAEARAVYEGPEPRIDVEPLPRALADSTVIRHVWSNLIGNALKFSSRQSEPRVRISARLEQGGRAGEGRAVYTVEDNGVGFDSRHADKLFGVFKRLHSVDEFPGTGVGLAIAHRIVTRHGGRIWAESSPGQGARFHFTLPAVPEERRQQAVR
jgi:two-component system sensor histidine kinase/response regulator